MRRRRSTEDWERLAKAAYDECVELQGMIFDAQHPTNGAPRMLPPLSDPGTGPGFTRRSQAKNDLEHWRRVAGDLRLTAHTAGALKP